MIQKAAQSFVTFLERHNAIRTEDRDVYVYGCDIALYTILSTMGLVITGACFGYFLESIIIIALFYLNQSTGGGFHATSHLRCFITMLLGLLFCLATLFIQFSFSICILVGYLSLLLLLIKPLVLHRNKQYLLSQKEKMEKHSRIVVLIEMAVFYLVINLVNSQLVQAFSIGLAMCALSRYMAAYMKRCEACRC